MMTVKYFKYSVYISLCVSFLNQKACAEFTAEPERLIPGQTEKLQLKCGPKEGTTDPIIAMMVRKADNVDVDKVNGGEEKKEEQAPPVEDHGAPPQYPGSRQGGWIGGQGAGDMAMGAAGGLAPANPFQTKYTRRRRDVPESQTFEYASLTGVGVSVVPSNEEKFKTEGTLSSPAHLNIDIMEPLYEEAGNYVCQVTVMSMSGQVEVQSQAVGVTTVQVENADEFGAMRASNAMEHRLTTLESQAKMFVSLGQGLQSSAKVAGEKMKILEDDIAALKRENKDLEDGLNMANAEVKSLNDKVKEMMENQANLLLQADSLMSAHDDIREAHERAVNKSREEKAHKHEEEEKHKDKTEQPAAPSTKNASAPGVGGVNFGAAMEGMGGMQGFAPGMGGFGGFGGPPGFYRGYPANQPYGYGGRFIGGWHNPAAAGGSPPKAAAGPSVEEDLFAVNNRMGALDNTRIQLLETQMQDLQTITLDLQSRMTEVQIAANYTLPDRMDRLEAQSRKNSSNGVLNRLVHLETSVLPVIMANLTSLRFTVAQLTGEDVSHLTVNLGPAQFPVSTDNSGASHTEGAANTTTTNSTEHATGPTDAQRTTLTPEVQQTTPPLEGQETTLAAVPTTHQPTTQMTTLHQPTTLQTTMHQPTTLQTTVKQPTTLQTTVKQPTTIGPPTTLPPPQPTTVWQAPEAQEEDQSGRRKCYVCGDQDTQKACTRTNQMNEETCSEDQMVCITDNFQDGFFRKVYRRCGKLQECVAAFEKSAKECLTDPFLTAKRMECHFCCTSDLCNAGIRPEKDLYQIN